MHEKHFCEFAQTEGSKGGGGGIHTYINVGCWPLGTNFRAWELPTQLFSQHHQECIECLPFHTGRFNSTVQRSSSRKGFFV